MSRSAVPPPRTEFRFTGLKITFSQALPSHVTLSLTRMFASIHVGDDKGMLGAIWVLVIRAMPALIYHSSPTALAWTRMLDPHHF